MGSKSVRLVKVGGGLCWTACIVGGSFAVCRALVSRKSQKPGHKKGRIVSVRAGPQRNPSSNGQDATECAKMVGVTAASVQHDHNDFQDTAGSSSHTSGYSDSLGMGCANSSVTPNVLSLAANLQADDDDMVEVCSRINNDVRDQNSAMKSARQPSPKQPTSSAVDSAGPPLGHSTPEHQALLQEYRQLQQEHQQLQAACNVHIHELLEARMAAASLDSLKRDNERLRLEADSAAAELVSVKQSLQEAYCRVEQLEKDLASRGGETVDQFHPRLFKPVPPPVPSGDAASASSFGGLSAASEPIHMTMRRQVSGGWSLLRALSREGRRQGSLPPTPTAPRQPVVPEDVLQLFDNFGSR